MIEGMRTGQDRTQKGLRDSLIDSDTNFDDSALQFKISLCKSIALSEA